MNVFDEMLVAWQQNFHDYPEAALDDVLNTVDGWLQRGSFVAVNRLLERALLHQELPRAVLTSLWCVAKPAGPQKIPALAKWNPDPYADRLAKMKPGQTCTWFENGARYILTKPLEEERGRRKYYLDRIDMCDWGVDVI